MKYELREIDSRIVVVIFITDINNPPSFEKEYICEIKGCNYANGTYYIFHEIEDEGNKVMDCLTLPIKDMDTDTAELCYKARKLQEEYYLHHITTEEDIFGKGGKKGCNFCNGEGWDKVIKLKPCANGEQYVNAMIEGDVVSPGVEKNLAIIITMCNRAMGFFDINYCPICGRKLE